MKAITVRQPWAWLLIHGTKDIENRSWPTRYRGQVGIHSAKGMTLDEYADACEFVATFDLELAESIPAPSELIRGAVIGTMTLRDCVRQSASEWFTGRFGFVMSNPEPCDPVPAKGRLGIWEWDERGKGENRA